MNQSVGFLGLGNMGQAMAARLLEQGWNLSVWNRTPDKAAPLVAQGATLVHHPEDTAQRGGILISMLSYDSALFEQFGPGSKIVERLGPGGVHLSMSTIHPETSRRLAQDHQRFGAAYLAAPVFGRPEAARSGALWIAVSGPEESRRRAQPILESLSRGVSEFGDDPGAANVAKLCGNFLLAVATESLGEAAAFADKSGVGAAPVLDMLTRAVFTCPVYQGYSSLLVVKKFQPAGFRLRLGLKDVELAIAAARAVEAPLPLAGLVRDRALAAINKGRGDWDWTALTLEAAEDAGL